MLKVPRGRPRPRGTLWSVSGRPEGARLGIGVTSPQRRQPDPARQVRRTREGAHAHSLAWQSLLEYILLATSSLFVIVDPIATVPAFLAMTPSYSPEHRVKTARLACGVAAAVLLLFALAGKLIFRFLGITLPAFQLAASMILLLIALDMLRAQRSRVQ